MNQKGFANVWAMILVIIAVVGVGGYIVLNKKGVQPGQNVQPLSQQAQQTAVQGDSSAAGSSLPASQQTQNPVDEQSGAGGSGIPGQPLGAKFCKNQQNQFQETQYGQKLTISADKKSILLNGNVAVTLTELPSNIYAATDKSIAVTNSAFTSAVLSPTKSAIAFTVSGGNNGWGGIKGVSSGIVSPVSFQYSGDVVNPKWSYDSHYVVFSKVMPSGVRVLALADAQDQAPVLSAREKILDFTKISPPPAGVFYDISTYFWSQNKDGKVYSVITTKSHGIDYGEMWSVNASDQKWDFVCSLGQTSTGSGESAG